MLVDPIPHNAVVELDGSATRGPRWRRRVRQPAADDPDLEAEGTEEKVAGKIQKKVGDIEKVIEK